MTPAKRLVMLAAATSPLWFLAALVPAARAIPIACLLLLIFLCARESGRTPRARDLSVERTLPPRLSLDSEQSVRLTVTNRSRRRILLELRDDVPPALQLLSRFEPFPLDPGRTTEVCYRVRAVQRGEARFSRVYCRLQQGLGLLSRRFTLNVESESRVYPRFLGVDNYDLLAMIDRREEARRTPRLVRGQGTDFESLRAYHPGDDLRRIDWKVSAKRGALVSRSFQVEKGQQLTLLIDAGRFMVERLAGRPRFEHALNAAVMLSYVAQKRGDSVSLACFSNRIESWLPAVKGRLIMPRVLETLYAVQPRNVESDYWHVFARVLSRLQRRSLIVLMSEVLDRAGSAGLVNNLIRAARKHLVLCVVMLEEALSDAADQASSDRIGSYRKAAAGHMLLERQLALDNMRSRGIMVLETSPDHFSVQLVREYLKIRKADLL